MSFWNTAMQFFWREESLPVLVMTIALAFLLLHFHREDRKSVLNTLAFFLACLFVQFVGSLIHAMQFISAAAALHEAGLIGAGIAVIRLWGLLVFRIVLPLVRVTPPRIAEDIFVIVGYIAWGLVRLRYAGLDLGSIVATSAMITAVVAFAMQDTLGNILGGLALQLDNSIEIGDWIKVDDISGRVVDIRWRSTLVETRNWETVVFPNSQLMKNKFLVLGRRADQPVQWRRWVWFNVNLKTTPTRVINAVENAVQQAEINNVAKNPAPSCVLMEIDKGCARYALRYWLTDLVADDPTDGAVRWHIYTALERAGIKLAVEEQNVHYIKDNEKHEEALHQRELSLRVRTLRRVELFAQLTEDELQKLAERLRYAPFAKGNTIAKQGTPAQHWLFIIINGDAEVFLEAANGEKRSLNVLTKGDFFGEMSLMTGSPRVATVVAKTDVECYRLDKDAFEEILLARPTIAEEIAHVLVTRRAELDSALQNLDEAALHKEIDHRHNEVLATVKRFFGL
ncbi:MAG: mechanosensitive ion channel family protein [Gallionella sp.]|jgi:small-conductance mechanosensitive channel/CRP-like cAMP-binding protein|nr:mechanosensitive ion channel family protein [Gallionella sp.]MCK9354002.1 mechanosensitive ion channel family protein [Gallionella sp.]